MVAFNFFGRNKTVTQKQGDLEPVKVMANGVHARLVNDGHIPARVLLGTIKDPYAQHVLYNLQQQQLNAPTMKN